MDTSEKYGQINRNQDEEHFYHLVQLAIADGVIHDDEMQMLHRCGRSIGLSDLEIDDTIESTKKTTFIPPYELSKRFEQMYDMVKMILADGKIDNTEMRLVTGLALKSGFNENEIPGLLGILISGIRNGDDDEDLFKVYNKKRLTA